jgi:hypothetical protein
MKGNMKPQLIGSLVAALFTLVYANKSFAAPVLSSVVMSCQSQISVQRGGIATYTVTVSRTGNGNMDVYLTVAGVPTGATASFSQDKITFSGSTPASETATLNIVTSATTPACTYGLTVTATDGGSQNRKTCTDTLIVAGSPEESGVLCAGKLPDGSFRLTCQGAPNQNCFVQAATNLNQPIWVTLGTNTTDANGVFAFIDQDALNYPSRFYRSVPAN